MAKELWITLRCRRVWAARPLAELAAVFGRFGWWGLYRWLFHLAEKTLIVEQRVGAGRWKRVEANDG